MYVFPNTDIYFLTDVNLNNDYDHTIYFSRIDFQTTYFMGKRKFTLTNQSYQRKERGWLKVEIPQNSLWDCSYMMYRNTAYGDKWFYAFILSTEYVNDVTTLVNFEIDVIQTWFFDWSFEKCFVEREHSTSDELFENLVEENLDIGTDYNIQIQRSFDLTPTTAVILSTDDLPDSPDDTYVRNTFINNYYYPLKMRIYDLTYGISKAALNYFINLIVSEGKEQSIVQIYQVPGFIRFPDFDENEYSYTEVSDTFTPNFVNVDGYVPKNKKLFTYPYNFLSINNREGNDATYKWELWDKNHIGEFNIIGSMIGKPATLMYPKYYREIVNDVESGIFATDFPQNPWVGDAWQLYWAQHGESYKTSQAIGGIRDALGVFVPLNANARTGRESAPTLSQFNSLLNLAERTASVIAFKKDLEHYPNQAYGQANANVLNMLSGNKEYALYQMTIRSQFAAIIDEYFSKYGYASHRIKIPNLNARQYWTYTKTIGCEINGNIPSDDLTHIKRIFDHGITFWNTENYGDNVGDYGDFTNPVYSA